MTIYYQDDQTTVYHGDCIEVMRNMPDNSVHAIVTDPPYGLGFMGAAWDALPPGKDWAEECLRVLKPGGHLLAFGGTRTWHRLAVAIEDAGFEIRDSVMWLYGSGFPKSHDVSKAIDKAAGAERERVPVTTGRLHANANLNDDSWKNIGSASPTMDGDEPVTPEAERWSGWGTALKPANEPIVMARKPFKGTVAANVLEHGTGALNIDAARISMSAEDRAIVNNRSGSDDGKRDGIYSDGVGKREPGQKFTAASSGRWPANVILDEHTAQQLDQQSGVSKSPKPYEGEGYKDSSMFGVGGVNHAAEFGDSGGASRFFYVAKAPKRERPEVNGVKHATVKPLTLMRYLVRMITPPNGIVLDPFAGSGTTIEAAILDRFRSIGIESADEYMPLIQQRIDRSVGAIYGETERKPDH